MILVLFLGVLLAQADDFVTLEICYLDYNASPWEFRPHPTYPPAEVRPSAITGIIDARVGLGRVGGIHCTQVHSPSGSLFVVGSPKQIREKLRGGAR